MSKRFPIPEFNREELKSLNWAPPELGLASAVREDEPPGARAIAVDEAFCERFGLRGEHRHAVLCVLPRSGARLLGRSFAWYIQRALILDGVHAGARVLFDWRTPRPMNTRLGPDDGVELRAGPLFVVLARRNADHWLFNRTLIQAQTATSGLQGFRVCAATDEHNNDFHASVLSFTWTASVQ